MKEQFQTNDNVQLSLDPKDIKDQLQKILANSDFEATKQQSDFLSFVVLETISGRQENIKGYEVATKVFGRSADFDPSTDPIVSMQANKLRRALGWYYLTSGVDDFIRIDIPKGCYVPVFSCQEMLKNEKTKEVKSKTVNSDDCRWPTIAVFPFENFTRFEKNSFLSLAIAEELCVELGYSDEILVSLRLKSAAVKQTRFELNGSFYEGDNGLCITIHLKDNKKDELIFSESIQTQVSTSQFLPSPKIGIKTVISKIIGEQGEIGKLLHIESRDKPLKELSAYEAMLRYYEFNQNITIENFEKAIEALNYSCENFPNCGLGWSMHARFLTTFYSLGVPEFETSLDRAKSYAENGLRLDPKSQKALSILAWVYFHGNNIKAASNYLHRALNVAPDSLLFGDSIGYIFVLLGEWEQGTHLIRRAMKHNPYYSNNAHYGLWLDYMRQKKYTEAYLEMSGIVATSMFWHPLAKASTLGLMGEKAKGQKYTAKLLELQPDFVTSGKRLIGRHIKHKAIQEAVIEGLRNTGLELVCS